MPIELPENLDDLTPQALSQIRGPYAKVFDKLAKQKLAQLARDTLARKAVQEADEAISAGTAEGVDETPAGPAVVALEGGVYLWEQYKIAQNAKTAAKLLAAMAIVAANVQVQEEEKDKKDCSKKPNS